MSDRTPSGLTFQHGSAPKLSKAVFLVAEEPVPLFRLPPNVASNSVQQEENHITEPFHDTTVRTNNVRRDAASRGDDSHANTAGECEGEKEGKG